MTQKKGRNYEKNYKKNILFSNVACFSDDGGACDGGKGD